MTLALLAYLVLEYPRLRGRTGRASAEEPRGGGATARTAVLWGEVGREAVRADMRLVPRHSEAATTA